MNRLSEYITGMKLTRQFLKEARIKIQNRNCEASLLNMINAFDTFVSATSCVISIKDGKRPKEK